MKSLVTGGAGFIGSNLVDRLLEIGHDVIVIDNESSDAHDKFYWTPHSKNYNIDIRDYKKTRHLYNGVDYVFHLAAESRIQSSIQNPIETISINTLGTGTVLQCAREAGVKRVIYSSTSSAYGRNEIPNVETQSEDCLNPYSVSKVSGEKLCKMYTELFNLPTVIFRYFNVYGERQPVRGQYAPVLGIFSRQYKNGEPLTIIGDGKQFRDFVYVGDVVNANILAATKEVNDEAYGQVYNVGTQIAYTINDIANLISNNTISIPSRIGEIKYSISNITKIKTTFGWEPKMDLKLWIKLNV